VTKLQASPASEATIRAVITTDSDAAPRKA
jgi:hypothetical protein